MTTLLEKNRERLERLNGPRPQVLPRPPMRCQFCYLPSVSVCTEDVHWHLCKLHTISAGACGFYQRMFGTNQLITPEAALKMRKEASQ